MIKKAFDFFVFSNLFVAVCAVLMVYQTYYLFHLPLFYPFILFVFFGTLCSYNFHWYLTPVMQSPSLKVQWAIAYRKVHFILFLTGGLLSAFFLYFLYRQWPWLLLTAFITFLYSAPKLPYPFFMRLRKIAIAKTLFLALMWTHVTTILPIIIAGVAWQGQYPVFALNRFFIIYPVCIIFDARDREQDKTEGIRSLITSLSPAAINRLFWSCTVLFIITSAALYWFHFSLLLIGLLVFPGLLLSFLYNPLKRNLSDYLYYFVLDGVLILSPLLFLFFRF